jgi:LacI family gluconate utilization system Gnt-I transcriptional repressor
LGHNDGLRLCAQDSKRAAGYQALIGVNHCDTAREEQLLREQLTHRPADVLLTGLHRRPGTAALIARSQTPCVHLMDSPPVGEVEVPHCVGFRQIDAVAAASPLAAPSSTSA